MTPLPSTHNGAAADTAPTFEAQVREHQSGLRAFIRSLGTDDAWVDDLAQETFLVAYRRWDTLVPGSDAGKWLRGIARHLVANERRKGARRARLLPLALAEVLAREDGGADPSAGAERLLVFMRDCVGELPERSRRLLDGRYAQGASSATLAAERSTTAEAVRQTLGRIRAVVKECVERKLAAETP